MNTYETDSQRENRPVIPKWRENKERKTGSLGFSSCKLLYTEWINSKVLLYSLGNYTQYPV